MPRQQTLLRSIHKKDGAKDKQLFLNIWLLRFGLFSRLWPTTFLVRKRDFCDPIKAALAVCGGWTELTLTKGQVLVFRMKSLATANSDTCDLTSSFSNCLPYAQKRLILKGPPA